MHTTRKYAVGLVLAGVLAGCGGASSSHDVVVYKAGPRAVSDHPGGVGTTFAGISVPVSVDFRDVVTDISVKPGDPVHRGQPLVSLDPTPFASQAAALHTKQTLIQGEIQNAQGRMAIAQAKGDGAQVTALTAQIASYQGEYVIAQQEIDIASGRSTRLLSPIDGIIGEVKITSGVYAAPGQVLLTVTDTSHLEVTASLPIGDRPLVTLGAPADVSITPSPGSTTSGVVLHGTVVQIAAGASGAGQVFQATVDAANTADRSVLPGLQAYVRVTVDRSSPVVVSKLAVLDVDGDPIVYVVQGKVVRTRTVQIGLSDDGYIEILGGLKAGDLCVIVGSQVLSDGGQVRVTRTVA